jgi:putative transposase
MSAYSMDLRERVIGAYDQEQGTQAELADRFKVSVPWIKKLLRFRRETGSIAARPHGGGREPKFSGEKLDQLKAMVEQDPDATLQELLERSGVNGSIMAVHRALERLGSHRKKSRYVLPSKTART